MGPNQFNDKHLAWQDALLPWRMEELGKRLTRRPARREQVKSKEGEELAPAAVAEL
jgi:hypothetical protein